MKNQKPTATTPNQQTSCQKPYSVLKYQQAYTAATNKLIDFFTLHQIKKYIDYEDKTKFQTELMEEILKQLRQFLRKKAIRQFQTNLMKEETENGPVSLYPKFQAFDEIYFRKLLIGGLEGVSVSPFQTFDQEDEVLDQIETALMKYYSEI